MLVGSCERISAKACVRRDIELHTSRAQKHLLHPYRGMTHKQHQECNDQLFGFYRQSLNKLILTNIFRSLNTTYSSFLQISCTASTPKYQEESAYPTSLLVARRYVDKCSPSLATRGAYLQPRLQKITVDRCLPSPFNFLRYSIPTV